MKLQEKLASAYLLNADLDTALHIYTINKNNIRFKTYNVEKTGFEGGAKYQWTKKHTKTDTDPNILF